jgi:predicted TIM-barrel fold metal-dependent hydrolase
VLDSAARSKRDAFRTGGCMIKLSRRSWIAALYSALLTPTRAQNRYEQKLTDPPLALKDFHPTSMLHVSSTKVERARFPAIDFHTHLTTVVGRPMPSSAVPVEGKDGPRASFSSKPEDVLALLDRKNVLLAVNLTGGYGPALDEVIRSWHAPFPNRFIVFTEPWWTRVAEHGYPQFQADEIERASNIGAQGLKVMKTLGLYLRENVYTGPLIKVSDPRFDLMWEAAGAHRMPVAIHVSDPEANFQPIDRFNERYLDMIVRPEWSFYGRDLPTDHELQEDRNRIAARHPGTNFVALHMGNVENLGYMSECLDKYPNLYVEFGARVDELGRQPRSARRFFETYQDRILFGTDAIMDTPDALAGKDALYETYFRFLETEDEYFEPKPNARWRIYGIGLSDAILRKVYRENAERLLRLRA